MFCVLYHDLLRNSFIVIEKYTPHVWFSNLSLELCALCLRQALCTLQRKVGEERLGSD